MQNLKKYLKERCKTKPLSSYMAIKNKNNLGKGCDCELLKTPTGDNRRPVSRESPCVTAS